MVQEEVVKLDITYLPNKNSDNHEILVKGLPEDFSKEDVKNLWSGYAEIKKYHFIGERKGKWVGSVYVKFQNKSSVERFREMPEWLYKGRKYYICEWNSIP